MATLHFHATIAIKSGMYLLIADILNTLSIYRLPGVKTIECIGSKKLVGVVLLLVIYVWATNIFVQYSADNHKRHRKQYVPANLQI